jgi:PAS domain S-box-containing protein
LNIANPATPRAWWTASLWALCLSVLFGVHGLAEARSGRLDKPARVVVVDDAAYAPFAFLDAEGRPSGITVDVWKLWSRKTGVPVEFRLMRWESALDAVANGEADAVGGLFKTEERLSRFDFSRAFFPIATTVFFHKQIHGIRGLEDLQGFSVGVVAGDSAVELIRQGHPTIQLQPYADAETLIGAAVRGEVKVLALDAEAGRFYLAKHDTDGLFRETARPLAVSPLHAAVRKGNSVLLAVVADGFNRMSEDEIAAIVDSWIGRSMFSIVSWSEVRLYGAIIAVLLGLVFFWNLQLRRTVAKALREVEQRNRELQESENRFIQLFESAPVPMGFASDADGFHGTTWNEAWRQTFGYTREEADGRSGTDVGLWLNPDDRRQFVDLANKEQSVTGFDALLCCRDGSVRTCTLFGRFIHTNGRRLLMAVYLDVTQRKQAEDELRESESYNKVLFRDSHVALAVIDPATGRFIDCNQAAVRMYGVVDRAELSLKGPAEMSPPVQNDSRPSDVAAADRIRQALEFGTQVFEWRHQRPDGQLWDAEVHLMSFMHRNRLLLQLSLQDVTDRKQAEADKEKLQFQLLQSQKMESIGRLAGGVAHDFNNMLSVILGHAELVLGQTDPGLPLYSSLQHIREAAERSAELTRQLLAFARKQTVTPKVMDLNQTVEGMLKMLGRLIGEDIDLIWQPGADVGPVNMDRSQIDQLLVNLCVNARDAIGDTGKVTIETSRVVLDAAYCIEHVDCAPGDYVALTVSDNGCGIAPELLPHLFEPFFTTKEMGKGTGLGLATVYGIVKQNNGLVEASSEPGRGTTFRVCLPRHRGKAEQRREGDPAGPAARGSETILVVEDEAMILDIAKTMLALQGYTVLAAATPGAAIRLAREHAGEIHLLITDVVMPEMNGRELAKKLLSLYPGLKRLFMSGYTANVIAHHGVLDEGVHFMQKPFTLADLVAKVRESLETDAAESAGAAPPDTV